MWGLGGDGSLRAWGFSREGAARRRCGDPGGGPLLEFYKGLLGGGFAQT